MELNEMSTGGGMDKEGMVHTCNGILFNLRKNEVVMHVTASMSLQTVMPTEISQTQQDKYCRIPLK